MHLSPSHTNTYYHLRARVQKRHAVASSRLVRIRVYTMLWSTNDDHTRGMTDTVTDFPVDAAPVSWALADVNVEWTAMLCDNKRTPVKWGDMSKDDNTLRLKDTRSKYWNNRLEAPARFIYSFPSNAKYDWEKPFLQRMTTRIRTGRPLCVHLFSCPGSRNEYYGEWIVVDVRFNVRHGISELILGRLRDQSELLHTYYALEERRYRSHNESVHAAYLATLFPESDWVISHEPETLLDIHEPSVVHGVSRTVTDMSRSYTCDFVIASRTGATRLCIESKSCIEHVTPAARAKCRVLRDVTLTRVVLLVGNGGGQARWLDIGPIGTTEQAEKWHDDVWTLLAA